MGSGSSEKVKVDLHTHTTASDGSLTPFQLLRLAREKGLRIISITDHDTVAGVASLIRTYTYGVEIIAGIELTADTKQLPKGAELHILGYYIDIQSPYIIDIVDFLIESRVRRNKFLIKALNKKGYERDYEFFEKKFGENFGKPNIAKQLVEDGFCKDLKSAFSLIKSLRILRKKPPAQRVIEAVKAAGGLSVVAHPKTLKLDKMKLYSYLEHLKSIGLDGIEAYHPDHTPEDVESFLTIAKDLRFLVSGGSDFHGEYKENVELGMLNLTQDALSFPLPALV